MVTLTAVLAGLSAAALVQKPLQRVCTKQWLRQRLIAKPDRGANRHRHRFSIQRGNRPKPQQDSQNQSANELADALEELAREVQSGTSLSTAMVNRIGTLPAPLDAIARQRQLNNHVTQTAVVRPLRNNLKWQQAELAVVAAFAAGPAAGFTLRNAAQSIRQLAGTELLRQSHAAAAAASAKVLTWLPIVACLFIIGIDTNVRAVLLTTRLGLICILLALLLNLVASKWMSQIIAMPKRGDLDVVEVIDLLVIALTATGSITDALNWTHQHSNHQKLEPAITLLNRGTTLAAALDQLQHDLGPESIPVISTIRSYHRDGLPLTPTLERISSYLGQRRLLNAEADARRLPIRLSFPLVLCTLPAFALITIVPLTVSAFLSLHLQPTSI